MEETRQVPYNPMKHHFTNGGDTPKGIMQVPQTAAVRGPTRLSNDANLGL